MKSKKLSIEFKYILKRICAILAVLSSAAAVSVLICLYGMKTFETTIVSDNSAISAAIQKNVDSRFQELVLLAKKCELTTANSRLKSRHVVSSADKLNMYHLSIQIKNSVGVNGLARSMYIYYPRIDYVVSEQGCFHAYSWFGLQYPLARGEFSSWREQILQADSGALCLLKTPAGNQLVYVDRLIEDGQTAAALVVAVNHDVLSNILDSYIVPDSYAVCLLLGGQPVLTAGSSRLLPVMLETGLDPRGQERSVQLIDDSYVFTNPSDFSDLVYLAAHTSQEMLSSVLVVLRVSLFSLGACFLILLLVSLRLNHRQMAKMRLLLHQVKPEEGEVSPDVFSYISTRLDEMIEETYKNEQLMIDYQARLSSLFLASVLQSHSNSEAELFTVAERYGISLNYSQYRMAVLEGDFNFAEAEAMVRKLQEIGSNETVDALVTYNSHSFVVLLNSDDLTQEEDAAAIIRNMLDFAFPDKEARAGIGRCYDSFVSVRESNAQAATALETVQPTRTHPIRVFTGAGSGKKPPSTAKEEPGRVKTKRDAAIARHAKELINKEYANPLMGLYYVADKLNVSNSYLSTLFKNVYGVGVIQYINGLRIEKAKELILNTKKSIKEISQLVGFSSDISFIRVFKKYENMTPTTLRNGSSPSSGG